MNNLAAKIEVPKPQGRRRPRKMLVADLLCGAGGSSTGAARALEALGLGMELVCVNHWPVAIATHEKNHPKARHYCQDIGSVRPHLIVPEGYLDLLLASPTCTHHSVARGGKPTSDQQRSDPWHIVTWLTELRVKRVIIENVPEFVSWGPVDPRTGKPTKARKGEYFRAWCDAIRRLGFDLEWRILNAADYGDATTRRRFFLQARSDGKPIAWPSPTHAPRRDGVLNLGLKPWRAAREIIDWSIKGKSIFDRKKPLAAATLKRIEAGLVKFKWPEPFLVVLRNHMAGRSIDEPVPTVSAGGTHMGLVEPFVLSQQSSGRPRGIGEPVPTITTGGAGVKKRPGCARHAVIEPFVAGCGGRAGQSGPTGISDPIGTVTAKNDRILVEPFMLSRQGGGAPRAVDQPTPTQCAKHSHMLVSAPRMPVGVPSDDARDKPAALITPYYGSGSGETCHDVIEPLPTVTAKARFGLVVPITHKDGSNRARPDSEPLPTITTANRGELAFIAAAFGEREGQAAGVHSLDNPAPTVCAKGRINLVEPMVLANRTNNAARGTDQPVPGLTTAPGGGIAVIEPRPARGALSDARGDSPARGYDILFRMLEPHELAAAMGFDAGDQAYEFTGTKTDQVKQIGNAVPVHTALALVKAAMADAGDRSFLLPKSASH